MLFYVLLEVWLYLRLTQAGIHWMEVLPREIAFNASEAVTVTKMSR